MDLSCREFSPLCRRNYASGLTSSEDKTGAVDASAHGRLHTRTKHKSPTQGNAPCRNSVCGLDERMTEVFPKLATLHADWDQRNHLAISQCCVVRVSVLPKRAFGETPGRWRPFDAQFMRGANGRL